MAMDAALSPTGDLIVWGTEILEGGDAEPPGVGWLARVVP